MDMQSLRQPAFAIQLENIVRENFLAKHQIRQYFLFKILRYNYKIVQAFILLNVATLMLIKMLLSQSIE